MIKGIIFDLDGTLLDTIADLTSAANHAVKELGYETYSDAEIQKKVGHGFRDLITKVLPAGSTEELIDKGLELFLSYYNKHYKDKTRPYAGIKELVDELYSMGVKLGVNSNKRTDYTESLIRTNFPEVEFVDIIGQRENFPKKPDPSAAYEIMEKMGLTKEEVAYIGDSETDIATGKNAGVTSIAVSWGFRSVEDLKVKEPDYICYSPEDILKIVKEK